LKRVAGNAPLSSKMRARSKQPPLLPQLNSHKNHYVMR
jgi:hypothetical protein